MAETIEFRSRVGSDGVLDLHVPLGELEAGADVVIAIRKIPGENQRFITDRNQWHQFVEATYGSCAGLGVERLPQGELERRETIE